MSSSGREISFEAMVASVELEKVLVYISSMRIALSPLWHRYWYNLADVSFTFIQCGCVELTEWNEGEGFSSASHWKHTRSLGEEGHGDHDHDGGDDVRELESQPSIASGPHVPCVPHGQFNPDACTTMATTIQALNAGMVRDRHCHW